MKTVRSVLEVFGVAETELDHVAACDACLVSPDIDGGVWIDRCQDNPARIEEQLVDAHAAMWRGLRAAFDLRQSSMEQMWRHINDKMRRSIIEQLNQSGPLFVSLIAKHQPAE